MKEGLTWAVGATGVANAVTEGIAEVADGEAAGLWVPVFRHPVFFKRGYLAG